jgi:phosphoribosylformylglycinamidine synthase PurS subunit
MQQRSEFAKLATFTVFLAMDVSVRSLSCLIGTFHFVVCVHKLLICIEFELAETDKAKAEAQVKAMCEKLIANTVIENYVIELG